MRRALRFLILGLFIFLSGLSQALAASEESLPLWEYGAGVGFIRFEEYPASKKTRDLVLPFPTFQYRGEILRADDREGARANLFRSKYGSLQFGGGVLPEVNSENVDARQGMESIPWGIQIGPQWVYWPSEDVETKVGIYPAFLVNLERSRTNGSVTEAQVVWHIDDLLLQSGGFPGATHVEGRVAASVKAGSQDFLATYFEVPSAQATASRPSYDAKAGFLSYSLSYVQSIAVKKWNFYVGVSDAHYEISANRSSPLHVNDRNLSVFAGITYVLGESEARSIPENQTNGLINKIRDRSRGF
jgi:outer membrane protein